MSYNKCVLPFINYDYQWSSPCCILTKEYNDIQDRETLINDHLNNKRSKFCDACWKTEAVGIESKRQQYNRIYSQYIDQNIRDVKLNVIPVGNVCNLYCITCGSFNSTAWIKKSIFAYNTQSKFSVNPDIRLNDVKNIDQMTHIEFIGGETLQSQSFWKYLEIMNKNINFSLQTNGTVSLSQKQIDLLKTFKKFSICLSIDGYDRIFEYLRQPAKWPMVKNNIQNYIKLFGRGCLSYNFTVSNLNIFYIDKIMIELFKLLPTTITITFVHRPAEFCYNNLTPYIGKAVEQHNPGFFKNKKINWIGTKESLQKTLENLKKQDSYSRLNFKDHLPEVYDLIHNSLSQ